MLQDIDLKYVNGIPTFGGPVGALTVSAVPSPASPLPIGYGNSTAVTGLQVVSSYPSDDVDGGTDGTGRLNLYSYQRSNAYSFGETIRNFLMRWDAKAMTAWYGPVNGYDVNGNPNAGSWGPWTWTGSHYEANDHASIHGHWEVEVPDSTGALQGRLAIKFANTTTGVVGLDKSQINTNISDFHFQAHGLDHTGTYQEQFFRITGSAGYEKPIEWNNNDDGLTAARRWKLAATAEAETGSNAGTNLSLFRYDDTGTLLDNPLIIQRSNGKVTIGGTSGTANGLTVNSASGVGITVNVTNTGGQAYLAVGADVTARAVQGEVSGDTTVRFVTQVDGTMNWGDGTDARDTNLYRSGANVLRTDDSLEVGINLGVGTGPNATTQRLTVLSGSSAGQIAQFKRTTATDVSPVVTIETADTSSGQSLGFSVTGDTSSRCGIDANGKITWGSGSASRDVELYRSSANILATDHSLRATLGFLLNTTSTGSGVGVFAMAPAATAPTGNPTSSGVVIYVDSSGNLLCRTSAGNVRTLAAV